MAAVPFGFSFGDFVAAIEVIHKAAQALRRSAGARNQICQAAADLDSIQVILRKVQRLTPTTVDSETLAAIKLCAYQCHLPLSFFTQRIAEYEQHLTRQHDSGQAIMNNIEEGYWKIKWALRVENDVAKFKAAIGPGLATIDILLQLESLEKSTTAQIDMQGVKHLAQRTVSLTEQVRLVLQQQTRSMDIRFDKLDSMAAGMTGDSRKVLQHLPLLATHDQIHGLESKLHRLSTTVDSRAAADQIHHMESWLHEFSHMQKRNHTKLSTQSLESVRHLQSTDRKIDELRLQMDGLLTTLPSLYNASAVAVSGPLCSRATGTACLKDNCQPPCTQKRLLATPLPSIVAFSMYFIRKFLSSIVLLLAFLPDARAHLRTCMTIIRNPMLLSGNSIALTDALNRTKLLPCEYFCNWKVLVPWLQQIFQNLPGEKRVARGHFAMFKQYKSRTGPEISAEQWETIILAGDHVVMSILVTPTRSKILEKKCHRCSMAFPEHGDNDAWRTCIECQQLHCIIQAWHYASFYLSASSIWYDLNWALRKPPGLPVGARLEEDSENKKFARVHSLLSPLPQVHNFGSGIRAAYHDPNNPRRTSMVIEYFPGRTPQDTQNLRSQPNHSRDASRTTGDRGHDSASVHADVGTGEQRWNPIFVEAEEKTKGREYYHVSEGLARQEIRRRWNTEGRKRKEFHH